MTIESCAFQYATRYKIIEDTGLITIEKARELFNQYKGDFFKRVEADENPEMAIWINMSSSMSYGETEKHWCAEDFKKVDGSWYRLLEID